MSKTIANILHGAIKTCLAPISHRPRQKTLARLIRKLEETGVEVVDTKRGPLKFLALRGAGIASAVVTFESNEPETLYWLDTYIKPADVIWDIGASVGVYALYAGLQKDIAVYAFEPSALNYALLMEHVALNNLSDQVMPLCVGLSDETKMNVLHMAQYDPGSAGNSLGGAPTYAGTLINATFKQPVPSFTGDEAVRILGLKKPDHVKLDVDGIEGAILRGMPEALLHAKTVIVEVEGKNALEAETRIDQPLLAAGFKENLSFRDMGSKRNRLFIKM